MACYRQMKGMRGYGRRWSKGFIQCSLSTFLARSFITLAAASLQTLLMFSAVRSMVFSSVSNSLDSSKLRVVAFLLCFRSCASTWQRVQGCFVRFEYVPHTMSFCSIMSVQYNWSTMCKMTGFPCITRNTRNHFFIQQVHDLSDDITNVPQLFYSPLIYILPPLTAWYIKRLDL